MLLSLTLMLAGAFMGFVYLRLSAVAENTRVALVGKIVFALPVVLALLMLVIVDISKQSTHYAPAFISGVGLPFAVIAFFAPKGR